jgi:hypothetical protein
MNHTPQSIGLETVNSAYDNILLNNAQPIGPETVNPDNILPGKKAMISPQTIGLSTVNTANDNILTSKKEDIDLGEILDAVNTVNVNNGQSILNQNTKNPSTNEDDNVLKNQDDNIFAGNPQRHQAIMDADKQSHVESMGEIEPSSDSSQEESLMMIVEKAAIPAFARPAFTDVEAWVFSPLMQAKNKEALDHFVSFLFYQQQIGPDSQFRVVLRNAFGEDISDFMRHLSAWIGEDITVITTIKKQFVDYALAMAADDDGKFLAGLLHSIWMARNQARNERLNTTWNRNLYKFTVTHGFRDCWRKWFQTQLLGVANDSEATKEIVKSTMEKATGVLRTLPKKTMSAVAIAGKLMSYSRFN